MSEYPHVRVPKQNCPVCKHILSAVGTLAGDVPTPVAGDVTVCLECGALLEFTKKLALRLIDERKLDPETFKEIQHLRSRINDAKAYARVILN
jgi:hypothetical protein